MPRSFRSWTYLASFAFRAFDRLSIAMGEVRGQSTVRAARHRLALTFAMLLAGMALARSIMWRALVRGSCVR